MSIKTTVARLVGLRDTDIFFAKSMRHPWWLWRFSQLPLQRFVFPTLLPVDDIDRELSARIIAFYRRASESSGAEKSAMWERSLASNQAPLIDAVKRQDVEGLAELLRGFLRSSLVRGIDAGDSYLTGNWRIHCLKLLDSLVSLAEQIGVARAESSQGAAAEALRNGIPAVVADIERRLAIRIDVPDVGGPYGLAVGDQLFTLNSAEYVRMAWRVSQCVAAGPLRVLEVGAGYGALAHRFLQIAQVEKYTIIDLPEIACLQAYYLGKILGPEAVSLYGEPDTGKVRILPPEALGTVDRPNVVINQDSLPEIPAAAAENYLNWIRENLDGIFFSCNHETLVPGFAVTSLPELIDRVGGFQRVSRDMCWSRPGYVEEVYVPMRQ